MDDKKFKFSNDSIITNRIINNDDEVLLRKFEVYSYKFPNNTIYVGYTSNGLKTVNYDHRKNSLSPIYKILKEYPEVYPEVELTIENISYNGLHKLQRKIFDSNLDMKILNVNLYLYGY